MFKDPRISVRGLIAGRDLLERTAPECVPLLFGVYGRELRKQVETIVDSGLPLNNCLNFSQDPDILLPGRLPLNYVLDVFYNEILPKNPNSTQTTVGAPVSNKSRLLPYSVNSGDLAISRIHLSRDTIKLWRTNNIGVDGVCPSLAIYYN